MPALFPSRGFRRTRERASGLLFALGVDDLSLTSVTGHTITVARNGVQTMLDTQGRVITTAYGQPPFGAQYNSTEGIYEPGLMISGARTNVFFPSEDFGGWTAVGTPVRTAAALMCGDVALDLLNDNDAGVTEGYTKTVTTTGDAVKMFSVFVAPGTSTSTGVRWRDTTASANRLLGFLTWSGIVPSMAMTTGTYIGKERCANGVWRLHFQTTSVTAANTNQLEVYPATTSGLTATQTGTLYIGGVQVENSGGPGGSYIKTVSASYADAASDISSAISFPPQTMSIYIRYAAPYWSSSTIDLGPCTLMTIGTDSGSPTNALRIRYEYSSGIKVGVSAWDNAGTAFALNPSSIGAEVMTDLVLQLECTATTSRMRMDLGSGFDAYSTTAGAMGSAWSAGGIQIGDTQAAGNSFFGLIRRLTIAPGAKTLAEMRGLAV